MLQRAFNFSISTLTRETGRLEGALADDKVGPAVLNRLPENFAAQFTAQIKLVGDGGKSQSGAAGDIGDLTEQQKAAFDEMDRLTSAARRGATLAFGSGDTRLHSEFQVGIHEPHDLASEVERAGKIHAASVKYASDLAKHGWLAADAAELAAAIQELSDTDEEQNAAGDEKIGITATRTLDANTLYKMCLSIQNAANLAFPEIKIGKVEGITEARARFLLDEFPPRASKTKKPAGGTTGTPTPAQ